MRPAEADKVSVDIDAVEVMLSTIPTNSVQSFIVSPPAILKSWQVGEILQAIVQSSSKDGLMEIKIANSTYSAQSTKSYPPGKILSLQVTENMEGLVFKNLTVEAPPARSQLINNLLRYDLPKQAKIDNLFVKFNQLLTKTSLDELPIPLVKQLKITRNTLPLHDSLRNPLVLKQTIKNSGLFLEAKLAAMSTEPGRPAPKFTASELNTDLKANLLKTISVMDQSLKIENNIDAHRPKSMRNDINASEKFKPQSYEPPRSENRAADIRELRNVVESVISRIQVNQSQAIVTNDNVTPVWLIDLPLPGTEPDSSLKLSIHHEDTNNSNEDSTQKWIIHLAIVLAPLGKIHVSLSLYEGNLSSSIWAEQAFTNTLIRKKLPELQYRLEKAGLNRVDIQQTPLPANKLAKINHPSTLVSTQI